MTHAHVGSLPYAFEVEVNPDEGLPFIVALQIEEWWRNPTLKVAASTKALGMVAGPTNPCLNPKKAGGTSAQGSPPGRRFSATVFGRRRPHSSRRQRSNTRCREVRFPLPRTCCQNPEVGSSGFPEYVGGESQTSLLARRRPISEQDAARRPIS